MRFKKVTIGEVCDLGDGAHSKVKRQESGIPYLTSKNIKKGYLDLAKIDYISEEDYLKLFSPTDKSVKDLRTGDILVGIIGTFGNVYLYKNGDKFGISSSIGILRPKKEMILPEFLYFQVKSELFSRTVEMIKGGSVQGYTNIPTLKTIPIYLPSLYIQQKIVETLSVLEEKINTNLSIISNLEELSQELFNRWFIDFEFPNEKGLPYRSSGGEMVGSELGEIPRGWEIVKLREVTKLFKSTFNPKKSDEVEVKHFSLPAFDSKKYPTIDKVVDIKSNKWIVEDNCVLFSKMNPITPRIWIPKTHEHFLNVASSEFVVLKSSTFAESAFIYSLCTSHEFIEYLKSNATGSTNSRQRITPDKALEYKFAMNHDVMMTLSNILAPFIEKLRDLYEENNKLEKLRDTLLPKLLSGEIEIPDESVVESYEWI